MTEFDLLQKPEYIHVVLNHLPIYGTILGALALAISLILRSRAAQITALAITLLAAASAYPVLVTGQRAYKEIRGLADDAGAEALDEHMDRAEKTIGVFYFLALLAMAGLVVPIKWPKTSFPLAVITLGVALICSGLAVYIAQAGGQVRHPEFRPSESPTPATESDHQGK
jgi:uncharacterized membrane protein HdeD (DUF308 family)